MNPLEEISIQDFNDRLGRKASEKKIPYRVQIEITYGCNLRCVHCYNPTHKILPTELKFPQLQTILAQLALMGCMQIGFTGGEPLLRRDAFDLFFYAKSLGFQIMIFTNATLIDESCLDRLKELDPALLSISVYGISRETYEAVTQVPGSFEKFMKAVHLLKDSGIPLSFKMPVMTLNKHELELAHQWFQAQGLPFTHSVEIHPRVDGNLEPLRVRLSSEDAALLRAKYERLGLDPADSCRSGTQNEETALFTCSCGKNSFAISPYGEMNLCQTTHFPKYSLSAGDVKEGWKVLVDFVDQVKPTEHFECPTCALQPYCTQGAMDAWLEKGDFNPCLPYFKETALKTKELVPRRAP